MTKRVVLFDEFSRCCPYFTSKTDVNNGYGCNHPDQEEKEDNIGKCYCWSCPLGLSAEQEDYDDPVDDIDWDGFCDDGDVTEDTYLLVDTGDDASKDQVSALQSYDKWLHQWDKEWLQAHGY